MTTWSRFLGRLVWPSWAAYVNTATSTFVMIGFPLGILASNAVEWFAHKYVLHGLGKRKSSYWSFHWNEHHKAARKNQFYDADYERPAFGAHAQGKEVYSLLAIGVSVLPLFPIAPYFCAGTWTSSLAYYLVHKKSHLDPAWARKHVPWHYDHHMGPQQDANWCVTLPICDHLFGTRIPYCGTEQEQRDLARKKARKPRPAAAQRQHSFAA